MNKSPLLSLFAFLLLSIPSYVCAHFPILCEGRTQITYQPNHEQSAKCITCYTPVQLDWDNKKIECHRSKLAHQPQIKMTESNKELFADHLLLVFYSKDHKFSLDTLQLFGQVKLIQKDMDPDSKKTRSQYMIADRLNYDTSTEEIELSADKNRQVYYYDELNSYEMNAKSLKLKRNKESRKNTLSGIGAVHFSFKEDHLNEIKDHISSSTKEPVNK